MTNEIVLHRPETTDLDARVREAREKAQAIEVKTDEQYVEAATFVKMLKAREDEIVERFKDPKKKAHEAHKSITAFEQSLLAPVQAARGIVNVKMAMWKNEQDRLRREEEARLQAEARRQAEELRLRAAAQAEEAGDKKQAEALMAAPVTVAPVILPPSVPKVAGVSYRKVWRWRPVDANAVPDEFWMLDTAKLDGYARSMKESAKVPGIEFFTEDIVANSGRA